MPVGTDGPIACAERRWRAGRHALGASGGPDDGGAMTATRTRRTDTDLRTAIADEVNWTAGLDATHIGIAVNGGAVTLSGEVNSYPERRLAERAALRVRGVSTVADEITVRLPGDDANDADIARHVGEALQRAVDIPDTVSALVHGYAHRLGHLAVRARGRRAHRAPPAGRHRAA